MNAQISNLPEVDKYHRIDPPESRKISPQDKSYWDNGNLKVEYRLNPDSSYTRYEYFNNATIRLKADIEFAYSIDTTIAFNDSINDYEIVIIKRLYDRLHGSYEEYFKSYENETPKIKMKGQHTNYYKTGEWVLFDRRTGNRTHVNFNQDGEIDGIYEEYYFIRNDSTYQLKIKGQFGKKKINHISTRRSTGKKRHYTTEEIRRIGRWEYLSKNGGLLEFVNYTWIGNE